VIRKSLIGKQEFPTTKYGLPPLTDLSYFLTLVSKESTPRGRGFAAGDEFPVFLKNLKQTLPQVKLVFIGPEPQAYYARHSATMGADLYLSEGQHPNEWLRRLRAIAPQKGKPVATTHCGSYPIRRGLVSHQTSREEEI